ncbi:hypothetical protein GCM10027347_41490 [Larkinella harenae]
MFESIRSYLQVSRLAKAINEAQSQQYTNLLDATRVCNRLFSSGKDYSVVKHKNEEIFWVVRTRFAKALTDDGHILIKPKNSRPSKK